MSTIKRTITILKSWINAGLAKFEKPEVLLNQHILDLKNKVENTKMGLIKVIRHNKTLKRKYKESMDELKKWESTIKDAIKSKNKKLARKIAERIITLEKITEEYKKTYQDSDKAIDIMNEKITRLNEKIKQIESKRNMLLAKKDSVQARKELHNIISNISLDGINNGTLKDTEEYIKQMEDSLKAEEEAFQEIFILQEMEEEEYDIEVEAKIKELEKKLKKKNK